MEDVLYELLNVVNKSRHCLYGKKQGKYDKNA
jgi:hypothetical protein